MLSFQIESWSAIAPGLKTSDEWKQWFVIPRPIAQAFEKLPLPSIPAMLRRRFRPLGKAALSAAMPLLEEKSMPCVFASRHGDLEQSLKLLQILATDEPLSPTIFSLSVHNAISGLLSIARKDTSAVTAIAASEGLLLQALFEAIGQLQKTERVLLIIYDAPLPEFHQSYQKGEPFPYAIAMILNRHQGTTYSLEPTMATRQESETLPDPIAMVEVLLQMKTQLTLEANGRCWKICREETHD